MIPAWLLAVLCFASAATVTVRLVLDRRRSAQALAVPSLIYLGVIYGLTALNAFGLASPDVRANVIRWPILLVVAAIGLASLLSIVQARWGRGP